MQRNVSIWAVVLLSWTLLAPVPAQAPDEQPLRLEDVVRMHVAGTPPATLIERIRTSGVDFDLSPEMLDELRIAGLPEPVIAAMVERQRELRPPPLPPQVAEEQPQSAAADFTLRLDPEAGRPQVLRMLDPIPPDMREQLGLADDETTFTDLAVYVACLTATHVPDHWRGQSPLGRDFVSMPRHRLLAFVPGAERERAAGGTGVLVLELPPSLELRLEPEGPHDLSVGVAVQAGDRYYRLTSATWSDLDPVAQEAAVAVRLAGQGAGITVRFVNGP